MAEPAIQETLLREISAMTEDEQRRVLTLIRGGAANPPRGATWEDLRHVAGTLDKESAREMRRQPGGWEGRVEISDDFDQPLPDPLLDAFEGKP